MQRKIARVEEIKVEHIIQGREWPIWRYVIRARNHVVTRVGARKVCRCCVMHTSHYPGNVVETRPLELNICRGSVRNDAWRRGSNFGQNGRPY